MKGLRGLGKIGAAMLAVIVGLAFGSAMKNETVVRADEGDVEINEQNFPDAEFRAHVESFDNNPKNGVLSKEERDAVRTIACQFEGIKSLTGIGYFRNLETLDCSYNQLTELKLTNLYKLQTLVCSHNQITLLLLADRTMYQDKAYSLELLDCSYNQLQTAYLSNARKLKTCQLSHNQLTKVMLTNPIITFLDVSYNPQLAYSSSFSTDQFNTITTLTSLKCEGCEFTELDLSKSTNLKKLVCGDNRLTKLDLSKNTALTELDCHLNMLTELTLGSGVRVVDCSNNVLEGIELSNCTALTELNCKSNYLTAHPSVPSSCRLKYNPQKEKQDGLLAIDKTAFPDVNFMSFVKTYDTNPKDGYLSQTELAAVTSVVCPDLSIRDLSGIEYFTNVSYVKCSGNQLSKLDLSKNPKIKYIYCFDNQIESLILHEDTNLVELLCSKNKLSTLDLKQTTNIRELDCRYNQLTSINVSAFGKLEKLMLSANKLTSLNVRNNPELTLLYLSDNQVSTLDLSQNTKLCYLNCSMNQLKELDVSNNTELFELYCHTNGLKTLDLSNCTKLGEVDCKVNYMTAAPTVPSGCVLYYVPQLLDSEEYVHIDAVNFPDENFRNYVSEKLDVSPTDGYLSKAELAVDTIKCYNRGISSLKGIEFFTSLKVLSCESNDLTSLDVSVFTDLTILDCSKNQIEALDVSHNTKLKELYCGRNPLDSLDVTENAELSCLYCNLIGLTKLDVSKNTKLVTLSCADNELESIDVSRNTKIQNLYCSQNRIEALQLEKLSDLKILNCDDNNLTGLELSNNLLLKTLSCKNNEIAYLNLGSNKNLITIYCANNDLAEFDVSNCKNLQELHIEYNYLPEQPTLPNTACKLWFAPQKTEMAISEVTAKANSKTSITISWNKPVKATGYELYFSTSRNGEYTLLDTLTERSKIHSGLTENTEYYYKVRAYLEDNNTKYYGAFSNVVSVKTIGNTPTPTPVTDKTVEVGKSFQYTVSGVSSSLINWSTGNTAIATVDSTGKVTGKSVGNTYLHVALPDGTKIKCLVRVVYPTLSIRYSEKTLHINQTFAFTVNGAAGQKITWSVGNTAVATVDSNGKVTGKSAANTYLYAKSADGRVAKCLVKVIDPGTLGINYTEKTVYLGQSFTFTAKNVGILKPTWSVGNTAIATVDSNGKVTSVLVGNTYLYVKTEDGRSARCLVKVVDPGPLNIRYTEKTIKVGESFQFTAKNPAGQTVTWRVGNTAVATVDANGVVTGKSAANTWLYASTPDGRETKCLLRIVA